MTWAQRLKRVFNIDVSTCLHCGGAVRIVASIEEPKATRAILVHFRKHGALEDRQRAHRHGRVTPAGREADGESSKTTRSGNDPAGQRTARCRQPVANRRQRHCQTPNNQSKRSAMTPQARPNRRLHRLWLPRRLPRKGV
jgi:hypothetical protein